VTSITSNARLVNEWQKFDQKIVDRALIVSYTPVEKEDNISCRWTRLLVMIDHI